MLGAHVACFNSREEGVVTERSQLSDEGHRSVVIPINDHACDNNGMSGHFG